jgi:hypothetical protein
MVIETYRALGGLDAQRLMVPPMLAGAGRQLTPDANDGTDLSFLQARPWPNGVVELAYRVR